MNAKVQELVEEFIEYWGEDFETGNSINGGDFVAWMAVWYDELREAVK